MSVFQVSGAEGRHKVTLTTVFDVHRADAVELRHALDFREEHLRTIWKSTMPVICEQHHSRIRLQQSDVDNLQIWKIYLSNFFTLWENM